jgi:glycosyltransferase involved in cell wall biosynthesis
MREVLRRGLARLAPAFFPGFLPAPADWPQEPANLHFAADLRFTRVHVFRLFMAPFALPYLQTLPSDIDLDESESRTRDRLAALHRKNGNLWQARRLDREARFYRDAERSWLPRFRQVLVSSESERRHLRESGFRGAVDLLPNTLELPPPGAVSASPAESEGHPFTFLFVGNLNYYPNADAVRFFHREVLPFLRPMAPRPFRVRIVGGGGRSLRLPPGTELQQVGFVEDLTAEYRQAHAVIVPLRAGGGTRIKILEAFAWRRPVVSTSVGAEGLGLKDRQQLLLRDGAESFAAACALLMNDAGLPRRLAHEAEVFVRARYGRETLQALL